MSSVVLSTKQESEWNCALTKLPHTFEHTIEYARAIEMAHQTQLFCFIYENHNGLVVIPFSTRQFKNTTDLYSPYGHSGIISSIPAAEWLPVWLDFVKSQEYVCSYLLVNPFFKHDLDPTMLSAGNSIYTIDMSPCLDTLFSHFHENHRWEIKKIQHSSPNIITDKALLMPAFLSLYPQFIARIKAKSIYHFSAQALQMIIENENSFLVGIEVDNVIVAASLFVHSQWHCNYFLSASTEDGKIYTRLILWEAIKLCKSLQIPLFNLGGGIQSQDSLAQFKRRFGAIETPVSVLKQIYDEPMFAKLCNLAQCDRNSNFFPPYYS